MANSFKNVAVPTVGTTPVELYTAPADTSTVLIGFLVSNIVEQDITATLKLVKADGTTTVHLIKNVPIEIGTSFIPAGGDLKIVLMAGDKLTAQCSLASGCDILLAMLENS